MHKRKKGWKKVTSRKQAIAIGLSEAREEGAKVPAKNRHLKKPEVKKQLAKRRPRKLRQKSW